MRFALVAIVGVFLAAAAAAATFTDADYAYLRDHWGLKRAGTVARNLTPEQQGRLHQLINDPAYRDNPQAIENHVGDYLFKIETCFEWTESRPCPNAPSAADPPGKRVAFRSCIFCHLVGSADIPSFFRLARQGGWTADRLGAAVQSGHRMSPITLSREELQDLAAYIATLK